MTTPVNVLQTVQTYQLSGLAGMQNFGFFVNKFNKKFQNFQDRAANLGSTVTFTLPTRGTTVDSLNAKFQTTVQRVQPLVVSNEISYSYAFTDNQMVLNVKEYMAEFGTAAIREMGTRIEANVAQLAVTNTYRFFGNGVTPINSPTQLAEAMAFYRNYGAIQGEAMGVLSDVAIPAIVAGGLAQFAPDRNDKMAMSWQLNRFADCEWFKSNLLPVHQSGSEGTYASTLTVVSFTTNGPDNSIDTITFSGTHGASDTNSIKQYDKLQFNDGVSGFANMRYLTFVGHLPCSNPVQFSALSNAASTSGSDVTVSVYPYLQALPTAFQNLNQQIQVGMQVSVLPSHRAGVIMARDSGFLAMPQLPNKTPYPTGNAIDPITGMSIRQYHGSIFGQNTDGMVHDAIYGATLVPEDAMAVIFPV